MANKSKGVGLLALTEHINRRVQGDVKTYAQLYPVVDDGCLLDVNTIPEDWRDDRQRADAKRW